MEEEEAAARALLERAGVTADTYAVRLHPKLTRARMAAEAIVELAQAENAELIVLGARRRTISSASAQSFGGTVKHVLEDAQCRVMLVAPSRERPCARDAA
jgi:nucleotide-binding universal stress UspA family protein